jgi:hypothetical protein
MLKPSEQVEQARQEEAQYEKHAEQLLHEMLGGASPPAPAESITYWFEETWRA